MIRKAYLKTMKITILLVLASTFCVAQTGNKAAYDQFKKELEAYKISADTIKKQAHCSEYELKYTVKGQNSDDDVLAAPPTLMRNLCDDLKSYDNNPSLKDWTFDFKAIGDQYYIIRADKKTGTVIQQFYYYQRRPTTGK